MRKFRFRLQPVLQFREQKEEQALLAHSRAQREYLDRVEELNRTNSLLEESFTVCNEGPMRLENQFHLQLWRERLINDRDCRREDVARAGEKLERCRMEALEARHQRMILQKLKEKQLQAHILEANRADQKEVDEQGLRLFWCRRN
ncbi:flagellar export protein FliJ [Desulfofundulus sp.]|uniref:flagellar export protein FliJ n=1 Tax=Desulfofundulus sp. TaxID=2282750 RepID=UPI003C76F24E